MRWQTKANAIHANPEIRTRGELLLRHYQERSSELPKTIINSIGMRLALIPAGEFEMGSHDDDKEVDNDEKPQHRVLITRPFYLGIYEVTQAQYKAIIGGDSCYFSPIGQGKNKVAGRPTDQNPVDSVSWFRAIEFCNRLSREEGLKPFYEIEGRTVRVPDWKGPGYRLPTEVEWKYSCLGANARTRYSFSDNPAALGEHGWYKGNSGGQTHPVGQKGSNSFGLFDMHGNVSEWCWDEYVADSYKRSSASDPPRTSESSNSLIRGG